VTLTPAEPFTAGHQAGEGDWVTHGGRLGLSRYALFVDVGYLYAAAGQVVLGSPTRAAYRVDTAGLVDKLLAFAAAKVTGELLRMYWYDAARDKVPTVEQRQVAVLPHVKVRLGNLNRAGQQKGVDALLRHDLETLARHQAVTDVVLLAGDEDLVDAVETAQAYGVRVHVWGVEPPYGSNQADRLVWEADSVFELAAETMRPYFTAPTGPAEPRVPSPLPPAAVPTVPAARPPTPATVFPPRQPGLRPGPDQATMEEIGEHIAGKWLVTRGRDNVADLLPGPFLPVVIDKELLVEAEQNLNRSLRPYDAARRWLRDGFWARLHREFDLTAQTGPLARTVGEAAARADGP
jgi:uncharacterized LabA/DUF88 family protein